eukprot:TRINITY_DN232_c0_g3_i1.p1 TRINITY_DN232_c0_g3~~TRINITY_DN232_c0_g3_i1.p1  ORF type:complete len:193 (-),score=62.96 TRINITY_DN232_c0_g3_i1:470-991(-)
MTSMQVASFMHSATSFSSSSSSSQNVGPNQTLYISNLNEKVKLPELKKSLYHVFSQFGNIVSIEAKKTYKLRGQAWIIFEDLNGAQKAAKEMQSFNFYDKPMHVSFAKVKSDVISKSDGTFVPRPKRKLDKPDNKSTTSSTSLSTSLSSTDKKASAKEKRVKKDVKETKENKE